MKIFIEKNLAFSFHCKCGSKEFERPEAQKNLTSFFEGSFICVDCENKYDYTSKVFKRNYVQTKLF